MSEWGWILGRDGVFCEPGAGADDRLRCGRCRQLVRIMADSGVMSVPPAACRCPPGTSRRCRAVPAGLDAIDDAMAPRAWCEARSVGHACAVAPAAAGEVGSRREPLAPREAVVGDFCA